MTSAVHAPAGEEIMRRFAEGRPEQAVEMEWRETGFAGGHIELDLLLIPGSQKVTGTAETTKSFVVDQAR
jgi:hypothetical protein